MTAAHPVPEHLRHRPFTTREALSSGLTAQSLRGARFRQVFRGVHVCADLEMSLHTRLAAALMVLPAGTVVSHLSAMRLLGFDGARQRPEIELSTRSTAVSTLRGVRLHRRQALIHAEQRDGLLVTTAERTFVDCALSLSFVQLVMFGDGLVHQGLASPPSLRRFADDHHLHGVLRARRASRWVVAGSESPRETMLRLMLAFARLPFPLCNHDIVDGDGRFLARGDLVFVRWKVLVEYDGRHHETDPQQWRSDRGRRERLEAEGWRVIVIAAADLEDPAAVPWRVHAALVQRGYVGPAPVLSDQWRRWFAHPGDSPTFEGLRLFAEPPDEPQPFKSWGWGRAQRPRR
jgi:hypothetical protein